jgi:DNA-binding MarR family transcriptional regulator
MLADQFVEAATAARTTVAADELAHKLWRAHAEGILTDADAKDISEALQARRTALSGQSTGIHQPQQKPVPGLPRGSRRLRTRPREKMFGLGRPRPMDRNAKTRITHLAHSLSCRTEKGKAYGALTAKALSVLDVLLWIFHNAKTGLCFPSYERIAEAACCARSTVAEAIKALEDAGILSWVNRIKRVAEATRDLFGHSTRKTRVIRTSNGYAFIDPKSGQTPEPLANSSKSDFPTGTPIQESISPKQAATLRVLNPYNPLEGALSRLGHALGAAV